MKPANQLNQSKKLNSRLNVGVFISIGGAVLALILTFLMSVSTFGFTAKALVFVIITVGYIICITLFHFFQPNPTETLLPETEKINTESIPESIFSPEIEEKLIALEEANTIFGASLKPSDMFRLVANRINEMIQFTTAVIFLADSKSEKLKAVYSFGEDSTHFLEMKMSNQTGLVGKTFQNQQAQFDEDLQAEKMLVPIEKVESLQSGIACPLLSEAQSYGVLALYSDVEQNYDAKTIKLISAIGERISPLFLNSINFERSLNNALVDALTNLPNERALFFILENQIAESQRLRKSRPLTVLSLDIHQFTELNKSYGHATGDQILSFVAKNIKGQLRQMDFLARVVGDEFLAVLPTSSEKNTEMIIERISKTFETKPFIIDPTEKIYIKLNYGLAEFLEDGETANDLLKIAKVKKQEAKSPIKSTILWFPKEHLN